MSTAQQLQRSLEERAKEIEQLQNKLQRAEADRQKWEHQKRVLESKQPQDVQALTRQKRELQSQLQREESEKQELFMQINKLIGEVAELQNNAENSNLPDLNRQLESQLQQLKTENSQLKVKADSAQQKLQTDLQDQKLEVSRLQRVHEAELNKLSSEVHKYQKEVEVKDAALQSLKLARPSSKEDSLEKEINKLRADLVKQSQENSQLLTQKLELEQFKGRLSDELSQLKRQIQEKQQNSDQKNDEILEIFEHAGLPSTSGMGTLKRKLASMKTDATDETTRRKKLETELDQLRQTLNSSNTARQELTRRIEELRDENERLTEKASVEEELHTLMLSLREAKSEISAKEMEAADWRKKSIKFEEKCDLLQSDLDHKNSNLQKAEEELHSLRSMAVDTEILSKLESELREAKKEANDQRQKLHDAVASREHSDVELMEQKKGLNDLRVEITTLNSKLEESDTKRHQLEQKRVDEVKRLRDEHRLEIHRIRKEFVDDKERIEERVVEAKTEIQKTKIEAEETRKSVEEAQKRLANALNCTPNFDLMLSTITENQRKLSELERNVDGKENSRHENEIKLSDEIRRLKSKEHELQTFLLASKEKEQKLEDTIKQLEVEKVTANEGKTEHQQLLESDIGELNEELRELREKSREEQRLHDTEMRNMRDEMIENIRRLSDLLEAETKRLQVANGERDRLSEESQKLERECKALRQELNNSKYQMNGSTNDSELKELRSKVSELMDENATLAGDLLKLESTGANGAVQDELRHAQRHFAEEHARWNRDRKELEDKIQELKLKPISPLANGINGLNGNPTPKPRKLNGNGLISPHSLSNLTNESADEASSNEDPTKIKSELEKQKRLINVLRKKLQHQQIERVQQSRSFCTS